MPQPSQSSSMKYAVVQPWPMTWGACACAIVCFDAPDDNEQTAYDRADDRITHRLTLYGGSVVAISARTPPS